MIRWTTGSEWLGAALLLALCGAPAAAQAPEPDTRTAHIERAQAEKAAALHPYVPSKAEHYLDYAETYLTTGLSLHPYFESAYSGGGFTLGAGYRRHVSGYNTVDVRGSITLSAYKRLEAEFLAPRLAGRQLALSFIGGWREATDVGFYGLGMSSSADARANYGFNQPYATATATLRPRHRVLVLRGQLEGSQWDQTPGSGSEPSVDEVYTPDSLAGLGATVTYLHSQGTVAIDWRPSAGYARRGGSYGVTIHDFRDPDHRHGFTQVDYEAIQHVPLLREAWVLSFRGAVSTASAKDDQQIPFFMLPSLGSGSSLRGYPSWRFRDTNSLLLQAEWRVIANRFVDMALFTDAGKVVSSTSDLNLNGLKADGGIGFRLHGPLSTPLRIDLSYGSEGFRTAWSSSAVF